MNKLIAHVFGMRNVEPETLSQATEITECRLCGSDSLWVFLMLGNQPLANALLEAHELQLPEFVAPLALCRCMLCGHVQLTHTVPPEVLFAHYRYASGVNAAWHEHCERLAGDIHVERHANCADKGCPPLGFIIDIASNDGTLLEKFAKRGWRCLGVDPAENFHPETETVCAFWNGDIALSLLAQHGSADLIVAQNVFGHVSDPVDFLVGVSIMLSQNGQCIIEVPSLLELVKNAAFDTIYHEHLSYWSLDTLQLAATMAGLVVTDIEHLKVHGGSLRVTLRHSGDGTPAVFKQLMEEHKVLRLKRTYKDFPKRVNDVLTQLKDILQLAQETGKEVWAYGASAKGATLLNLLDIIGTPMPVVAIDDSPLKWGYFMPGSHVPIYNAEYAKCDILLLLAWNWADEMKKRARERGFTGKFLIPLPEPHLE